MEEIKNTSGLVSPEETEEVPPADPMSPEHAPGLSLIVQMRTYDALMALLRETNVETAEQLIMLHAEGNFLGPMPYASEDVN